MREPIVPTEEEEGLGNKPGQGGIIPSVITNTNADDDDNDDDNDEDGDDDDLTTVVKSKDIENTVDGISSNLNHFYCDFKSMRDSKPIRQKNYAKFF